MYLKYNHVIFACQTNDFVCANVINMEPVDRKSRVAIVIHSFKKCIRVCKCKCLQFESVYVTRSHSMNGHCYTVFTTQQGKWMVLDSVNTV